MFVFLDKSSAVFKVNMTDPIYNVDFFIDHGIVKQEPFVVESNNLTTSASVPIPARRPLDISDIKDFVIDLDASNSPSLHDGLNSLGMQSGQEVYTNGGSNILWGTRVNTMDSESLKPESFKMDDDDIFQVDKADLIQGPTLAELNANDDTLLADLSFDDLLLPEEKSYYINVSPNPSQLQLKFVTHTQQINNNTNVTNNNLFATSCPQNIFGFYKDSMEPTSSIPSSPYDPFNSKNSLAAFSPQSQNSSTSSLGKNPSSPPSASTPSVLQQKHSTLHELLMKKDVYSASPERSALGQSVPTNTSQMATSSGNISFLLFLG